MRKPQLFPFCLLHYRGFGMDQLGKRMVNLSGSLKGVKWGAGCKNEWYTQFHSWASSPRIQIILRCNIFKGKKVHLLFLQQNFFLKENNPWILNKCKSTVRLAMLSRIILSGDGICQLAHTKLVVWWTTNFVSNENISLCDIEIPQPREITGYTF